MIFYSTTRRLFYYKFTFYYKIFWVWSFILFIILQDKHSSYKVIRLRVFIRLQVEWLRVLFNISFIDYITYLQECDLWTLPLWINCDSTITFGTLFIFKSIPQHISINTWYCESRRESSTIIFLYYIIHQFIFYWTEAERAKTSAEREFEVPVIQLPVYAERIIRTPSCIAVINLGGTGRNSDIHKEDSGRNALQQSRTPRNSWHHLIQPKLS